MNVCVDEKLKTETEGTKTLKGSQIKATETLESMKHQSM